MSLLQHGNPTFSDEIAEWRFITPDELTAEIAAHSERFSPWLKLEWEKIRAEFLHQLA